MSRFNPLEWTALVNDNTDFCLETTHIITRVIAIKAKGLLFMAHRVGAFRMIRLNLVMVSLINGKLFQLTTGSSQREQTENRLHGQQSSCELILFFLLLHLVILRALRHLLAECPGIPPMRVSRMLKTM